MNTSMVDKAKNLVIGKWFYIELQNPGLCNFWQMFDYEDNRYFKESTVALQDLATVEVKGYNIGINGALLPNGELHFV